MPTPTPMPMPMPMPTPMPMPMSTPMPMPTPTPMPMPTSTPTPPPPPPPPLRPFASLGAALTVRAAVAPGLSVPVAVGVSRGPQQAFVEVTPLFARALPELGDELEMGASWELRGGCAWSPERAVAPIVAGLAGVSLRTWRQDGEEVHMAPVPVVGAAAGASVKVSAALAVAATARLEGDLRATTLTVGDGVPEALSPWQTSVGISFVARIP